MLAAYPAIAAANEALELDDAGLGTAKLLASELVTNAVLHGEGTITLRAALDDDRLLVEVIDQGSGFERVVDEHGFDKVGGWGLRIVKHRGQPLGRA
ncbi:MAG: ATP-binding protein [Actinomycetota bacterium]|nr:ATP-binding protein [Actinomycetota bacterium]